MASISKQGIIFLPCSSSSFILPYQATSYHSLALSFPLHEKKRGTNAQPEAGSMTSRLIIAHSSLNSGHDGTEMTLVALQDDLLKEADRDRCTPLVLLDLSEAFDTISQGIILDRLFEVGMGA